MIDQEIDLTVKKDDLVELSRLDRYVSSIGAGSFAILGFLPFSVGSGLFDWLLHLAPYAFLLVWFTIGYSIAAFTYNVRPAILRRWLVGKDFAAIFRQYRNFLLSAFAIASTIGVVGLTFSYAPPPWHNTGVGLTLTGLSYFGLVPTLTTTQILNPNRQARLSIRQSVRGKRNGTPDKFWLKRGLRRVEDRIPEDRMLSVARNSLFLGCLHQIFKGTNVELDLKLLSDWVVDRTQKGMPAIEGLLTSAGEARIRGLSAIPTIVEKIMGMPRWAVSIIEAIAFYSVLLILPIVGIPNPILDGLRQILSRL